MTFFSALRQNAWLAYLLGGLVLGALVLLAYQQAPQNGFHFDDYYNINFYDPVRMKEFSLQGLWHAAEHARMSTRPLPSATFAYDWWRGQGAARPFIWTNLFFHLAVTLTVFVLLARLLTLHQMQIARAALIGIAALGAAAWAVHPIHVQGVTYIVQRMASMATWFVLLSVLAYLMARRGGRYRIGWYGLSLLAFALGALCKEIAWITPLLILLAEYGVVRHRQPLIRSRVDYALLVLPLLGLLFVVVDMVSGAGPLSRAFAPDYAQRDFTLEQRVLTQPRVVLFHFSQVLWPLPQRFSIEHDFAVSTGLLTPWTTLPAWLAVLSWCALGVWLLLRQSMRLFGFALLWVPVTLAIESSFVPLEMVFEHRMYLPSVGLVILLALGLARCLALGKRWSVPAFALSAAFIGFAAWATHARVPDWKDDVTLYASALDNAPASARLWSNYGLSLVEANQFRTAIKASEQALKLDPQQDLAMVNLGVAWMNLGDLPKAEDYFMRAYALIGPTKVNLLNRYGELLYRQGRYREALGMFLDLIKLMPWMPEYRWNIAKTYEKLGDCANAAVHWQDFLHLSFDQGRNQLVRDYLLRNYQSRGGQCYQVEQR
ncbi:MAG: tetratricopeptide repeat protein [Pseudomonadota bacterium]